MARLVAVAIVTGFATAVSAATLSVITTNTADIPQTTFVPGETVVLRVDGNSEGAPGIYLDGRIVWLSAGGTAFGADQSQMFQTVNPLLVGAGFGDPMNQIEPSGQPVMPMSQTFLGHVRLVAGAPGSYTTFWTGLNFFGIGDYTSIPSSAYASFTIVPEPATAALIGLGLLGLVLGVRRPTRNV